MTNNEIIKELLSYLSTDSVLYFSPEPEKLLSLQKEKWGKVIKQFNELGTDVQSTTGLSVPPLSDKTKQFISTFLSDFENEKLMWFRQLAGAYRSVILATLTFKKIYSVEEAFDLSCLEELFQNETWSTDKNADEARQRRKSVAIEAFKNLGV